MNEGDGVNGGGVLRVCCSLGAPGIVSVRLSPDRRAASDDVLARAESVGAAVADATTVAACEGAMVVEVSIEEELESFAGGGEID